MQRVGARANRRGAGAAMTLCVGSKPAGKPASKLWLWACEAAVERSIDGRCLHRRLHRPEARLLTRLFATRALPRASQTCQGNSKGREETKRVRLLPEPDWISWRSESPALATGSVTRPKLTMKTEGSGTGPTTAGWDVLSYRRDRMARPTGWQAASGCTCACAQQAWAGGCVERGCVERVCRVCRACVQSSVCVCRDEVPRSSQAAGGCWLVRWRWRVLARAQLLSVCRPGCDGGVPYHHSCWHRQLHRQHHHHYRVVQEGGACSTLPLVLVRPSLPFALATSVRWGKGGAASLPFQM